MDNALHALLSDIDDIHLQMHCTIESVRQCYVAMTQTSLDKGTQRKTTENELPSLTQCTA